MPLPKKRKTTSNKAAKSSQELITKKELAFRLGCSAMLIDALVERGIMPYVTRGGVGKAWEFDYGPAARAYKAHKDSAKPTADDARERKLLAEAMLKELQLAERRRELIPAETVALQLDEILGPLRTRLLSLHLSLDASFTKDQRDKIRKAVIGLLTASIEGVEE